MKTRYGTRLVNQIGKEKDKNYIRMREIAIQLKRAKASDVLDDRFKSLELEFALLVKKNHKLQERVNNLCLLETFLEN